MEVNSLYFDDPPAPPGEPGLPFDGLWDYEGKQILCLCTATEVTFGI